MFDSPKDPSATGDTLNAALTSVLGDEIETRPFTFGRSQSGVGEIDDLAEAVAMLNKVDMRDWSGQQGLEALIEIETLRNQIDALAVKANHAAARTGFHKLAGHRQVSSVLTSECRLPRPEAHRRSTLAKRLSQPGKLGPTSEAFAAGEISFAHANLLARLSIKEEIEWAFDDAEATLLVPSAKVDTFRQFELVCQRFYEAADTTQGEKNSRRNDARQRARVSQTFEGEVRVDASLNAVHGETVLHEFERLRRSLLDEEITKARAELGRDPLPSELERTADQRSAAALALMAQRSASLGQSPVTSLPCVNITIDHQTFIQMVNEAAGLEANYPANGVRRTENGIALSPRDVMAAVVDGHIRRVVFGTKGNVLDFGRKTKFFVGALREAVMLRDKRCVEDGCDVPARFCEIDHATSRHDGGETSEQNGNCRCRFHNGRKGARSVDLILEPESRTVRWFKRRADFQFDNWKARQD